VYLFEAMAGIVDGDAHAARRDVDRASQLFLDDQDERPRVWAQATRGVLERADDDRAAARRDLEESIDRFGKIPLANIAAQTRLELAALHLDDGRVDDARREATAALAELEREKVATAWAGLAHATLARIALTAGDADEARKQILIAHDLAEGSELPAIRFTTATVEAQVRAARAAGDDDLAVARHELAEVIDEAGKLGFRAAALEARLALGALELRGHPSPGRARLDAVAEEAEQLGQKRLARLARETR
jgi:hypothetical protein